MEVMIHNAPEFDFPSSSSTPQSPARLFSRESYFFSAPTSPARLSDFYREFDNFSLGASKPITAATGELNDRDNNDDNDDFAFEFSEDLERASLSADELFDRGVIKPTMPRERGRDQSRSPSVRPSEDGSAPPRSVRRATRSLSPIRESSHHSQLYSNKVIIECKVVQQKPCCSSKSSSSSSSKKWRLRDFLLFRSASEGRAADKDPLRKYYYSKYNNRSQNRNDVVVNKAGSESGRVRSPVALSPHGRHYTANKAVSEDLKKKTFLPYKQGILGRLSFNPAVHALANGFGSFTRA